MKAKKGFTLIELLIVIAIIAILALIAVPNFLEAQTRAKVTRGIADMRSIGTAMESYMIDQGAYPPDYDGGAGGGLGANDPRGEWKTWRSLTTPMAYLTTIPRDVFHEQDRWQNKPNAYYQYWGWQNYWNNARKEKWRKFNIMYFMNGLGPDKDDDALSSFDDPVNDTYAPSNGTVSNGDIGMSNTGFFLSTF